MKTKIKEIQDYFLNKIYNCEFEVTDINKNEHVSFIMIDGEYKFLLWTASKIDGFAIYGGYGNIGKSSNFMQLDIDISKSNKVFDYLVNYGKPTETEARAEKVALIAKLTEELEQL